MNYNTKLLLANCIPIVVFAIISLVIGATQFQASMYIEKRGNLKSTALAAQALYAARGYGDFARKADGNVWRGMNFNVSDSDAIVDDLKAQTNIDITFFFDDIPEMTSLIDDRGIRWTNISAIDAIREHVLRNGAQLACRRVQINGITSQAYIIPLRQDSTHEVFGALMASQSIEGYRNIIRHYILAMLVATIASLAAVFIFIRQRVDVFAQEFYAVTDRSKRDLLTGLYNKRSFEEEVKMALINKNPNDVSTLLILDFDNFKHVNDTYGHQVGDEVLKAFSNILVRAFRTKDIIGRIGGDEFMVFMPAMSEEFIRRSEEISKEILHELNILKVGRAGPFSCSIGIGTDSTGYDFKNLYLLADNALYESKQRGKACFTRYSSDEIIKRATDL